MTKKEWLVGVVVPLIVGVITAFASYEGAKSSIKDYICNANGGNIVLKAGDGGANGGNGTDVTLNQGEYLTGNGGNCLNK